MKSLVNKPSRRGSALVAVFVLMSILALAVFSAVRMVSNDADIVTSQVHGSRARHLAERGIAVAAHPRVEPKDPILKQVFKDGAERFIATIESEAQRFNINAILLQQDKALLRDVFTDWEMPLDEADALVDALIDWVDSNEEEQLNGAEFGYYEGEGQKNFPYNRPFYDLEEMRLVRGMASLEEFRPDWRNWFTIWSAGKLDVNQAAPELIAAAARVSIDAADGLVEQVLGPDGERFTEDDQKISVQQALGILGVSEIDLPTVQNRLTDSDTTTRLESIGISGAAKRKIIVILRNRTGRPTILQRMEEILP